MATLGAAAAGSGLNTVVVINQASSNSCELGNYYCEMRDVPPENVLHVNWTGTNTAWSSGDFQTNLLGPLLQMLTDRELTNQIDYVVCSMDIPFQTTNGSTINATTSVLFYGLISTDASSVTNSYAASEAIFDQSRPVSTSGSSFLATMITADSLADAEQLVDQGAAGDGTFPQQPVVLAKSSDPSRNIRYPEFDNAIFNVRLRGVSNILRTNADSLPGGMTFLGYETGQGNYTVPSGAFVPGAIADNETSYGGIIFGPNTQTSLLAMIDAGASGSYGTVAEPYTDPEKFPNPQVYFYQARGFSLAESYYLSLNAPYLGLIVADPLSAPFAQPGSGHWIGTNASFSGIVPLSVQFSALAGRTFQQIDLFVDGTYSQTLTNVLPQEGNVLTVTLNGYPITYTVPANANLSILATGLAALLNSPAVSNTTMVVAYPHGDRVELQSLVTNGLAEPFYFYDSSASASNCYYKAAYLPIASPPKLTPRGFDRNGAFLLHVDIASTLPYVVEASTDLKNWLPVFTNQTGGLLDFADAGGSNCCNRFYRIAEFIPNPQPRLSLSVATNGGGNLDLHVDAGTQQPYAIQISTNFADWTPILTNQPGGPMDYMDAIASNVTSRFYRAVLIAPTQPLVTILQGPNGNPLLKIQGAMKPFAVDVSSNQGQWVALSTNYAPGQMQTAAYSSAGTAGNLATFITASSSTFLDSEAFGQQSYVVVDSPLPPGAYFQFAFTKTNGSLIKVCLTNETAGASATNFARQFYNLINATASLQGPDGVIAEDFGASGPGFFNLRARSPGLAAAALQVAPSTWQAMVLPSSQGALTQNISDLRPRNHIYLTAGASRLGVQFNLDTTALADGYHELTAVAYEGSNVRTQTKVTLQVVITNTSLNATLNLLDFSNTAPVLGSYHIQVVANSTNTITNIALYSTGGVLDTATNQSTAIFQFNGSDLGVGLHPFYALIQDSSGASYRTQTQWARLE